MDDIEDPKTQKAEKAPTSTKASYFTIDYWQIYFDINQYQLLETLKTITNPNKMDISENVKNKPELYGPFWIVTSLIFCLFAFGNLSGSNILSSYKYSFISSAISVVYGYFFIVPLLLFFLMKFQDSSAGYVNVF